jgi:hypothetical protein
MNPLPWPIGQKVVCVDDTFHPHVFEFFDRVPVKGRVYTITELVHARQYETGVLSVGVRLTELPSILAGWGSFAMWHFRMLEEMKASAGDRARRSRHAQHSISQDCAVSRA